jgi:hypothetical protein
MEWSMRAILAWLTVIFVLIGGAAEAACFCAAAHKDAMNVSAHAAVNGHAGSQVDDPCRHAAPECPTLSADREVLPQDMSTPRAELATAAPSASYHPAGYAVKPPPTFGRERPPPLASTPISRCTVLRL